MREGKGQRTCCWRPRVVKLTTWLTTKLHRYHAMRAKFVFSKGTTAQSTYSGLRGGLPSLLESPPPPYVLPPSPTPTGGPTQPPWSRHQQTQAATAKQRHKHRAFTHCSGAEHRTNCGYNQHQRWQQWRPGVSSLLTARTVDVQIVLGRLGYKYSGGAGAGGQGEAAVQPPKHLQVYCQKQRVLCREAVRLMGGEPEVMQQKGVVGWGGGSTGYQSRHGGQPGGSGAAACAARSCSRARGADFNVLVVCNDCHMTWDRDENASLNMRLLLILQLLGHDRPAVFCRQEDGAAC
eukprot:XP_001699715.1 hypothetical protein CHLREDRAFT_141749 [Chlamydomonas reinhardtii]